MTCIFSHRHLARVCVCVCVRACCQASGCVRANTNANTNTCTETSTLAGGRYSIVESKRRARRGWPSYKRTSSVTSCSEGSVADWAASGDCMVGLRFGTSADHGRCFSMAFIAKARALAGSSCCFADLGRSWCWCRHGRPEVSVQCPAGSRKQRPQRDINSLLLCCSSHQHRGCACRQRAELLRWW